MTLPPEFENELENWLNARLDERFARQQRALLEAVIKTVEAMLNEQIKYDGAARAKELEQQGLTIQAALDRMQGVLERQMARMDRAKPLDSDRMN